jgi:RNA polymerase sigma-70 factor (ECF subfamily)
LKTTYTPTDDKLLWQAFRLGDEVAFTTLYQQHVRVLYSYGKKLLADDAAVEDLIQDLFIDLWQNKERLSDIDSPRFYLFRSLRRRIYKALPANDKMAHNWETMPDDLMPITLPEEFYIIEEEDSKKQKNDLTLWLKALPVRQYEVLMLRYYEDFSYHEIAEILSINEQSVRNLVQRAVMKLRHLSIHHILITFFVNFFLLK